MQNIGAHALLYAFMVSGLFVPVGCFILEENPSLLSGYAFGGTTILLIITENKLPLGINYQRTWMRIYTDIFRYFYSLQYQFIIITKEDKMEFKIINATSGEEDKNILIK
jgi:hypothetical protein